MTTITRSTWPMAELKQDIDTGEFEGYASVYDVVDGGADVVDPGAFAKALPDFMRDGFISWHHAWDVPVAMPKAAYEDDNGLFLAGRYHSTPKAQEARTIAAERHEAGLRTGLSIGYGVEDYAMEGKVRHLKTIHPLYEVGLVMVPMNREANVTGAKGAGDLSGLPDAGSMTDSVGRVSADAKDIAARFATMVEQRAKEGRTLSAANRQLLADLMSSLGEAGTTLAELLDATDPDRAERGLAIDAVVTRARSLGIDIPRIGG
jgi:HK97 family phage prohead protease